MLGVGRSVPPLWRSLGLPPMTNAVLVDSAEIVRKLCSGEKVTYDGPARTYRALDSGTFPSGGPAHCPRRNRPEEPRARRHALRRGHPSPLPHARGRRAMGARCAQRRTPQAATSTPSGCTRRFVAPDLTPPEEEAVVAARAVTYFQIPGFGRGSPKSTDGPRRPSRRSAPTQAGRYPARRTTSSAGELGEVSRLLPALWLETAAVAGTASRCAKRLGDYLAAGADELILHGSTPKLLGPMLQHRLSGAGAGSPG